MENPIVAIRNERGLTRRQMAVLSDVSYWEVHAAERGLVVRPHHRIVQFLTTLGYEAEDLLSSYRNYRDTLKREIAAQLTA